MNQPTAPTDPGAVILYQCGLGCFVSNERIDTPRRERPVVYSSVRYLQAFWMAREKAFRVRFDELPDCIMQAREVD